MNEPLKENLVLLFIVAVALLAATIYGTVVISAVWRAL